MSTMKMTRAGGAVLAVLLATFLWIPRAAVGQQVATPPQAPARFADQIQKLIEQDRANPPMDGSILFIGSSIFRLWTTLVEQMAPLPVYNRAFGGSRSHEMLEQFDALVVPHSPRFIVYYCGSNDVAGGVAPAVIIKNVEAFVERVRQRLPGTTVFFVSINKAPSRKDRWPEAEVVNTALARLADQLDHLEFVDVNPVLFDAAGEPKVELYVEDMLHFKPPAYDAFTTIIKPVLTKAWTGRR